MNRNRRGKLLCTKVSPAPLSKNFKGKKKSFNTRRGGFLICPSLSHFSQAAEGLRILMQICRISAEGVYHTPRADFGKRKQKENRLIGFLFVFALRKRRSPYLSFFSEVGQPQVRRRLTLALLAHTRDNQHHDRDDIREHLEDFLRRNAEVLNIVVNDI